MGRMVKELNYKHTLYASYTGFITQAIVNNLAPLLFLTFQNTFSISLAQIGLLVSINFCVQMVVDFLATRFVDRLGYRVCIVTAHILAAAGVAGLGIFPYLLPSAYAGLMLSVIIYGIGGGLIEVLISPIVEALPGEEKASAMSLLHSFYCWGHVGVVLLSTLFFVTAGIGHWYILPLLWAIVPLCNTFVFAKVPLCKLVEDQEKMSVKGLIGLKLFWMFILLMICSGAAEQAMVQWASLFAESGLGVSKTVGDLLGPCAFAVLMGLSRVFYGKFGSRIDLKRFIRLSSILCIGSYLLAALSPWPLLSLAGCALCGLSVGIMWPGTLSLSSRFCPQGGTAMFALLALAGDVGCALGPGLVGRISTAVEQGKAAWSQVLFPGQPLAEIGLKTGLTVAVIFPLVMFAVVWGVRK
ncbi:MFS transporter [Anaerolentibacter hominis]|uniref:MFS transporter n=1 Tax=Anaerolentibacter hominis TaxID=3079009 RepID=UPI0031B89980